MIPHNTGLTRQNTAGFLALFPPRLGILIIGDKKFFPAERPRPSAAFSVAPFMTSLLSNPLNPRRPALAPADSGSIPLTRAFDSFTPAFDSFARANPSMTSLNESIARAKQLTSFQSNHPLAGASASMTHVIDAVTLASQLTPFETDARCPVDPPLLTAAESITVPQSQGGRGGGVHDLGTHRRPERRPRCFLTAQFQPTATSAGISGEINIAISPILNQNTNTAREAVRSTYLHRRRRPGR